MYKQSLMKLAIIAFAILLFNPLTVFAAEEKPPALVNMWVMDVDPDNWEKFEKGFKEHIKDRVKAGDKFNWQVYVPHTGSHLNSYIIRACCFKWADLDDYGKWINDSNIMEDWDKGPGQYVEKYHHQYSWIDMENSHWKDDVMHKYVGVTKYYLKPDAKDVDKSVKEISDLAKAIKWDMSWSWEVDVTGKGDNLYAAFGFENFAAMDPPGPSFSELAEKHLGSKEKVDEIFDRFAEKYKGTHYEIYRHRPDLSMPSDK